VPISEYPITLESKVKQPILAASVTSELPVPPSTLFAELILADEPLSAPSKLTLQENPTIKSSDLKAILICLSKLESERTASSDVISRMNQERQIMQQEIRPLDTELGYLKQYSELMKQEKLEILSKIKATSKDFDPNKFRVVIRADVQSKLYQEHSSLVSHIRVTTVDFQALKRIFNALETTVGVKLREAFFYSDRTSLELVQFQVSDPRGSFAKLEHELTRLANKFASEGGVDIHGFTFSHDKELVQCFKERN
jgi:hypothetical protein